MPGCGHFGPKDKNDTVHSEIVMTLDEFETIRLIDLEELTQEECAERMNVARTTAQSIYNNARHKLAECMVDGKELIIKGGEYDLCNGNEENRHCKFCCKRHCHNHTESKTKNIPISEKTEK
jgi:predicted DNA-binding protein (UPF0251 family)